VEAPLRAKSAIYDCLVFVMCFQDVMDKFFSDREDPEGALWHGLLYTFVGLGALAAMAAVR